MAKIRGTAKKNTLSGTSGGDQIFGLDGNDRLAGGGGNDYIDGGDGNDILDGGTGNDILMGGNGNDRLTGGAGSDKIFGGAGTDTAVFSGSVGGYNVTATDSGFIVSGRDGRDFVSSDVELLSFGNAVFSTANTGYSLTTGIDHLTGGFGLNTFKGIVDTDSASATTFNAGDVLDGSFGAGDLLNLTIQGAGGGEAVSNTKISNIEIVEISNSDSSGVVEINATLWSGVHSIVSDGADASTVTRVTNLAAIVSAEMNNGGGSLELNYKSAVLAGSSNAQSLLLSGNTEGTFTVSGGVAETLNIASEGLANTLTLNAANQHTTINVSGDKDLYLDVSGMTTLTAVNASSLTAGSLFVSGLGAGNLTITATDNDDSFVFLGGTLNSGDVIDGGNGIDLLGFDASAALVDSDWANVHDIELLDISAGTLTATLGSNAFATGINSIQSYGDSALNITIGAGFTGPLSLELDATLDANSPPADSNDTVNGSASPAQLTVSAMAGHVTALDTLSGGTGATDTLILTADDSNTSLANVTGFEFITVWAGATGTESVNIVTGAATAAGITTVNGSALTDTSASLNFDGSAQTGSNNSFNVTGGAGADIISGGAGTDSISGGDGDDHISGGSGADTLNGGAGDDTIEGGLGDDIIDAGEGADNIYAVNATNNGSDTISVGIDSESDTVYFDLLNATPAGVSTVTNFDASEPNVSEDILAVTTTTLNDWAFNRAVIASSATGPQDARLIILDGAAFASLADAAQAADDLQAAGYDDDTYLFAWKDSTDNNVVHVSFAVVDSANDVAQDLVTDLVKLPGVDLFFLDKGDFAFV